MGRTTYRIQTGCHFYLNHSVLNCSISVWKMSQNITSSTLKSLSVEKCNPQLWHARIPNQPFVLTCTGWVKPGCKYSGKLACLRTLQWVHSSKLPLQLLRPRLGRQPTWAPINSQCWTSKSKVETSRRTPLHAGYTPVLKAQTCWNTSPISSAAGCMLKEIILCHYSKRPFHLLQWQRHLQTVQSLKMMQGHLTANLERIASLVIAKSFHFNVKWMHCCQETKQLCQGRVASSDHCLCL